MDSNPAPTTLPHTRRTFVQRLGLAAGGLAVAPLIIPSRVLGRDTTISPANRITVGVIGVGRQSAYANIPGFLREADAQIVAVCDVDSWRRERAKQQVEKHYAARAGSGSFKGCNTFKDWRELIARADIDAVMIATPDHWHMIQAIAALKAGKDVACEKPLTRCIAEGRRLCEVVAQQKRVFRTDSEFRSNAALHRAAQLVRNEKLGQLQRIITVTPRDSTLSPQPDMPAPAELDYDLWLGPAPVSPYTEQRVHPPRNLRGRPGWISIRDYADGMLANWGAHLNDIAMWANDTEHTGPVEIEATGSYPPAGNLWNVIQEFDAHFRFANGVNLTCKTGEKPSVRFEGTEGWIQVGYPNDVEASTDSLLSWQPGANGLHLPFKTTEKRDFLDSVKSRTPPLYDAEAGHRVNSLSHLALASIQLGRKLRWDPAKETLVGNADAAPLLQPKAMRPPWRLET
ncbi:MAG TPA: Gfo/Idh/MocA family oxidoreductase [Verrucomicrobiae bacterium]|nr:Gfo/Idh/MocA family oxidoreductase [Verrucomicrobiae bacterium]